MALPLERSKMVRLTDLVFTAAADSNAIDADKFGKYSAITLCAPTGAFAGTVTVQVGQTDAVASAFVTLQSPSGTDLAIASAKAITISPPCFPQMRLHSTVAETLTFTVWGKPVTVTGM